MSDTGNYESAFSLFSKSKDAAINNILSLIVLNVLPGLLALALIGIGGATSMISPSVLDSTTIILSIGIAALMVVVSLILMPAFVKLTVEGAKGNKTQPLNLIKSSLKYFWRLLGLELFIGLLILLAFLLPVLALVVLRLAGQSDVVNILSLVFGIFSIVAFVKIINRYILSPYFLVDHNLSISEAMRRSASASKGKASKIWSIFLVYFLLIILAMILSFIPLFGSIVSNILIVLYSFALGFRYLELNRDFESNDVLSSAAPVAPTPAAPLA